MQGEEKYYGLCWVNGESMGRIIGVVRKGEGMDRICRAIQRPADRVGGRIKRCVSVQVHRNGVYDDLYS